MASYPYNAGDRIMLGISTWQSPKRFDPVLDQMYRDGASLEARADREREMGPVHGPSGPFCRYFKAGTVIANDREAGVMVIETDDPHAGGHGYDVLEYAEWDGTEVVPFDESLPQTASDAHKRAVRGEVF